MEKFPEPDKGFHRIKDFSLTWTDTCFQSIKLRLALHFLFHPSKKKNRVDAIGHE